MRITNKHGLPQPFVDAVSLSDKHTVRGDISVTQLIGPPLPLSLRKSHGGELESDASDMIWSIFGTSVHYLLEQNGKDENCQTEVPLGLGVQDFYDRTKYWQVSGTCDLLVENDRSGVDLYDYKVTSVWACLHGIKPEWEKQLNVYARLAVEDGKYPDNLYVITILRDWQKSKAQYDSSYPQAAVMVHQVRSWSRQEADDYLAARIRVHFNPNAEPECCTDEERWAKPGKWAVMKGTNMKATKLCESAAEATEYINQIKDKKGATYHVVERPSQYIKCESYCDVARFCPYYTKEEK